MNLYVRYRDLSRAITAHPSPGLPEAFDSGAFGGDFVCSVVQVVSLLLQLRVVDVMVGMDILLMFDPVVTLKFSVELFRVVGNVVVVLADSVVFGVVDSTVPVVVRLRWCFVFGRLDVGVGVQLSPATVQLKRLS